MKSLSKELFIMALLLMIVVFIVGIIFYEYMPNNKTVPEPITYQADSSTTSVIQEIAATTTSTGNSTATETQSVIKSYSIGTKELTSAAAKNSYTSGKTDPFAAYNEVTTNTTDGNPTGTTDNTTTTTTNAQPSNNNSGGSTTGTFFESSSSK